MNWQKYFPQALLMKQKNQSYLDNPATTLKLKCVSELLKKLYETQTANVHRGDHYLSEHLTSQYEQTRSKVQKWIGAKSPQEIIFTKSTTEGLNFLSQSLESQFKKGDEILLTAMEHHSNLLPWGALAQKKNLQLKFVPVDSKGELILSDLDRLVSPKTRLFSFVYYSNALGTRNPVEKLITFAQKHKLLTVIDAAQAMTVEAIDVQKINCDFLVFSGHKVFAPEGIGVLYAKKTHIEKLKPYQVGGGMVNDVNVSLSGKINTVWADPPHLFEAGTPAIGSVLALGSVLDFFNQEFCFQQIRKKESHLLYQAEESLKKIPGLQIIGNSSSRINTLSFVLNPFHCKDVGQLISQAGVAVRSGHHCCLPLMKQYGLSSGTVRAGFSIYNDERDVQCLVSAVKKAQNILLTS